LASTHWEERLEGVRTLATCTSQQEEVLPELAKAMNDSNILVRAELARALSGFGEAAVPFLIKGLNDPSSNVRKTSASALSEMGVGAKVAVSALSRLLRKDDDRYVRCSAAFALGQLGVVAREAVPDLVAALSDAEQSVRVLAAHALWKIQERPAAIHALVNVFETAAWPDRLDAARTLGKIGAGAKDAVPALIQGLQDKDEAVARCAAESLGEVGPAARAAIPALVRMLKDTTRPNCRPSASLALSCLGEATIPVWIEALKDKDAFARKEAARVVGRYGRAAQGAKGALVNTLKDTDPETRAYAAASLGRLGLTAEQATQSLEPLLHDSELEVRLEVGFALWRTSRSENVLPELLAALRGDYWRLHLRAAEMCAEMGPDARETIADLTRLSQDGDQVVKEAVARALRNINSIQKPK
jgi:HEAT repeat protein